MRKTDTSRLPPLHLLAAFEAAARQLSFTRAAAERFVTQSAMSRQMRALEDELGVVLFQRRHRSLVLTPEGQLSSFVNVFLNDTDIRHLDALETPIGDRDSLVLLPAMAGG